MIFLMILLLLAAGYGLLFYASRQEQQRQQQRQQQESDRNRERLQQRQQAEQTRKETIRREQARTEQARQQFRDAEAKRIDSDRQLAEALAELEQQKQRLRQLQDRVSEKDPDQPSKIVADQEATVPNQAKKSTPQQSHRKSNAHPTDKAYSPVPDRVDVKPPKRSQKVTRQIKSKLEKLCGSDYRLAQRLVDGIRIDHPDRTEQWCWEKAVWDMERDRRR